MAESTIDLIRHGATTAGPVFLGTTDAPLSELGWRQLKQATQSDDQWQLIVSSPLRRCKEFAEQLAEQHKITMHVETGLREMDFGRWDGQSAEDIYKVTPELLTAFWKDPAQTTPPGGESWVDFATRVRRAWHEVVADFSGQHCLIVGHAGVQRMILAEILGLDAAVLLRIDVPHACRSRIMVSGDPASAVLVHHGSPNQPDPANTKLAKPA